MGLDSVEMIISVENKFGVHLADRDVEKVRTVGNLYELLRRVLSDPNNGKCRTQHIFYRLRRSLTASQRRVFAPGHNLKFYFDNERIRQQYTNLALDLDLDLPPLRTPLWFKQAFISLYCVMLLLATIATESGYPSGLLLWLSAFFVVPLYNAISPPFRKQLPYTYVRQFVERVTEINESWLQSAKPQNETLYHALKHLIVESLGVDPSEVTMNARFVEDLGLD